MTLSKPGSLYLCLVLFCSACSSSDTGIEKEPAPSDSLPETIAIKPRPHMDLLWSKADFAGDMRSENWPELERIKNYPYASQSTHDNLLLITTYFSANGCASYQGNIRISSDSLFLLLEPRNKLRCNEKQFFKVTYMIDNPGHKKYVVVKS